MTNKRMIAVGRVVNGGPTVVETDVDAMRRISDQYYSSIEASDAVIEAFYRRLGKAATVKELQNE